MEVSKRSHIGRAGMWHEDPQVPKTPHPAESILMYDSVSPSLSATAPDLRLDLVSRRKRERDSCQEDASG